MGRKPAKKAAGSAAKPEASAKDGQQAATVATANEVQVKGDGRSGIMWWIVRILFVALALVLAFDIRLYAIKEYGLVIHEFDPWFNYRATEYLHEHGLKAFFEWYDYMSWYPLGRPVGTTIYPGMQMTSVAIWHFLEAIGKPMSLNDICCYVPAWFGVSATAFTGLLTVECSGSRNAGVFAALVMACIPAHIMRSVGGGYDNESIAVTAMTMTFFLWCRSLRSTFSAVLFGVLAGLAYIYMVAAWGGYVFVINMIGLHAISLVFLQRFSAKLYIAYTLFFAIGTFGATQVPVVGLTPIKSLEQIGPLGVFGIMQVLMAIQLYCKSKKITRPEEKAKVGTMFFTIASAGAAVVAAALYPTGYFGPLSSRVRGLFVQHTRTGNPLVDSVAEHQPASANAYYQYLHLACYLAPIGFVKMLAPSHDSRSFLPLYGMVAYMFSAKMVRLIILLGPIASALSGIALASIFEWIVDEIYAAFVSTPAPAEEEQAETKKKPTKPGPLGPEFDDLTAKASKAYKNNPQLRRLIAFMLLSFVSLRGYEFYHYSRYMARGMSNPSIMYNARTRDGKTVLVDDYREAYHWLRDNTPEDSRVMAWWDYGYQIAGIANRTTIADGNTWNHEHIATLGRCLVSEEKQAHRMIRHLADYVLVWSGGGGDDLAKMPHIARIANSVYSDVCQGDPLCSQIGYMDRQGTPSPFMANTLIYKLHGGGQKPGVTVDPERFENVFNSKFNKVRIWKVLKVDKASKEWAQDPSNRICDPPGSWICKGQYPPSFIKYMEGRKDFAQLEDFNRKRSEQDIEYEKRYMEEMDKKRNSGPKK